jgi:HKD family nuclease
VLITWSDVAPQVSSGAGHAFSGAVTTLQPRQLRAGFAFATVAGVQAFLKEVSTASEWTAIKKQFLIGIAQGITEPKALEIIRSIANAETRIFLARKRLDSRAPFDPVRFHAKVACLDPHMGADAWISVSSANLTSSAIGPNPKNYEFGVICRLSNPADKKSFYSLFDPWWKSAWNSSLVVTNALLARYSEIRDRLLQANPVILSSVDPPEDIATAKDLWIEVGKGSGIQRHQVEFTQYLASFFGPVNKGKTILTLRRAGKEWDDRPLSHKKTTYGVDIWRLGMPTISKGGVEVKNRIVKFSREPQNKTFEIEICDQGSVPARQWERRSNRHGHVAQTRGTHPRRWGVVW